MSLAITAAPFDDITDTPINKKKYGRGTSRNKTYKNSMLDNDKVASVLETIHNDKKDTSQNYPNIDPSEDCLGDYFPPKFETTPASQIDRSTNNDQKFPARLQQQFAREPFDTLAPSRVPDTNTSSPQPLANSDLELQNLNKAFVTNSEVNKYYNTSTNTNANANASRVSPPMLGEDNILIDKLNYIINLIEEQKDERTSNVTEEVVLYSFLGVFVIFVVDSFARVGKYTR